MDRSKASRDLLLANREFALQNDEKKIRAEELTIASREVEFRVLKRMSALRESEERGNFFIDNVREYAIIFFDVNGNISTWNSGAERIKQYIRLKPKDKFRMKAGE
jgi:PAS domain-containing protein